MAVNMKIMQYFYMIRKLYVNYLILLTHHGTAANYVDFIEFTDGFRTSLPDYASWVNGTSDNDLIAYTSADETNGGISPFTSRG